MQYDLRTGSSRGEASGCRCNLVSDALDGIGDRIVRHFPAENRDTICQLVGQGCRQLDLLPLYRVHCGPHLIGDHRVIAVSERQRIPVSVDVIHIPDRALCSDIIKAIGQEPVIPRVSDIITNGRKPNSACPVIISAVLLQEVFPHVQVVSVFIHAGNGDRKIIPGI